MKLRSWGYAGYAIRVIRDTRNHSTNVSIWCTSMFLQRLIVLATIINTAAADGSALNFLVMGDWGGLPGPIWTTPAEKSTAEAMASEATKINATFALALGDNFYEKGIQTDEFDS